MDNKKIILTTSDLENIRRDQGEEIYRLADEFNNRMKAYLGRYTEQELYDAYVASDPKGDDIQSISLDERLAMMEIELAKLNK